MVAKAEVTLVGAKLLRQRLQTVRDLPRDISRDPRIPQTIIDRTKDRFRTKRGPDGRRWKALSRKWDFSRTRGNPNRGDILVDTGDLRDSIGVTSKFGTATGLGFRIGVDAEQRGKAATHQRGGVSPYTGRRIPPRRFLGISPQDATIVERLVKRIAREKLG